MYSMKRLAKVLRPKAFPLFPLCFAISAVFVWDIAEEQAQGCPEAVLKYSSYYPALFQAEDAAEPVPPLLSYSHHDVQRRFADLVGNTPAYNS